jgi:hypothetical protein
MSNVIYTLIGFVLLVAWLAGIVLAKGFWLTSLAIVFPFYPWYLLLELLMIKGGLI